MFYKVFAAIFAALGAFFLTYSYALNRSRLAVRLKRSGYYRCPQYQHKNILSGSDYRTDVAAAAANGTRADWTREQFAKYGKTFETKIWRQRVFQTCDSVNTQALLTASTREVGVGPSRVGLVEWLGPGAFTVDGEPWRYARDMLKPVFKKTAITDMSRLKKHLACMLDALERENLEVDLQEHFIRMFLDFSMELLIGQDSNTVSGDASKVDAQYFTSECDKAQFECVRSVQPWLIRWWKGWTQDENHAIRSTQSFMDKYVDSAVQDFETSEGGPILRTHAFLDDLIGEAGTKDRLFLRNQMLNCFMPGRDSVAIMASHVMFRLARHPEAYQKVRQEVLAAGFEDESMSYDAVKKLAYTNAVINEAMRLGGPPNGQTGRDVLSDIVLPRGGGMNMDQPILIPKGSIVYVQIQALQRDEDTWGPDPHSFRPERWIGTSKSSPGQAYEYMPFGGGKRTCPAMALVMGELAFILATFALRFREIQNRDPEHRLFEAGSIVMKIRNGVLVKLVR
ncbi:uncharacterized protein RCC_09240 [Ramularia collo-cygni]|uniref:Cytochrome P450 n=1 Tax=Ramularia collo-cygni TaxID=112498 RepID=A0A2D3V2D8_9PEZI|nr:uncharacterized protein RCC_09240 [Ramularia collo-cygni]CZT23526.1 uncharacterized protein RCC_09240 [Ramularia collo-cygni]